MTHNYLMEKTASEKYKYFWPASIPCVHHACCCCCEGSALILLPASPSFFAVTLHDSRTRRRDPKEAPPTYSACTDHLHAKAHPEKPAVQHRTQIAYIFFELPPTHHHWDGSHTLDCNRQSQEHRAENKGITRSCDGTVALALHPVSWPSKSGKHPKQRRRESNKSSGSFPDGPSFALEGLLHHTTQAIRGISTSR